jgi:hypothetical protein
MHASVNGAACAGSYNASMAAHKYLLMIANPHPRHPNAVFLYFICSQNPGEVI